MPFIYLATFKDGSIYVGQTRNDMDCLTKRYASYAKPTGMKRAPVQRICREKGMPKLTVLAECAIIELDFLERYWIAVYRQTGQSLNVASGGFTYQRKAENSRLNTFI